MRCKVAGLGDMVVGGVLRAEDFERAKTFYGVAEFEGRMVAWFKDTEDNIVSVGSM